MVFDRLRAEQPIFRAGEQTVPMGSATLDVARITGDPSAVWHTEAAAITPSDLTVDRVRFTARALPIIVKASMEIDEDAPNLGTALQRAIVGSR